MELNTAFHFKGQITPGSTVILFPGKPFRLSEQFNGSPADLPKYENSCCLEESTHPSDQVCDSHGDGSLVLMRNGNSNKW